MIQYLKNWQEKLKEKEKEENLIKRRETIMYNILVDLETEESIEMYNSISNLFLAAIDKRLDRINQEKETIENFIKLK